MNRNQYLCLRCGCIMLINRGRCSECSYEHLESHGNAVLLLSRRREIRVTYLNRHRSNPLRNVLMSVMLTLVAAAQIWS